MKTIYSLSSAVATRPLPLNPIADGVIHRFRTNHRPGDQAGWYVYYLHGIGTVGVRRTGEAVIFAYRLESRPADRTETLQQARQCIVALVTGRTRA